MSRMVEFENLLEIFESKIDTDEFKQLQKDFDEADNIYFIGNGGNSPVCSHASSDITRLTDKKCYSLDNVSYITSIANDYKYDNIFIKWLEEYLRLELAGYIAVGLVGLKLLLLLLFDNLEIPYWVTIFTISCLFLWGFSKKIDPKQIAR